MGQTINVTQSFSLYNVAGLIDKDKNIYYVPHKDVIYNKKLEDINRVCDCYKALFDEVCPSSSKYTNITISQWSPEDRVLRVNDTIDNFRVSRGNGLALNYIIVKREVVEEGSKPYYYSFFIDSVRQVGANTVELNVSPDYFTNFYYLNNEEELTDDYDAFNPIMRNCYVERQHYDRAKILNRIKPYLLGEPFRPNTYVFRTRPTEEMTQVSEDTWVLDSSVFDIYFIDKDTLEFVGRPEGSDDAFIFGLYYSAGEFVTYQINGNPISIPDNVYIVVSFSKDELQYNREIGYLTNYMLIGLLVNDILVPDNQEKILASEESFKYRYQYKDFRYLLSLGFNIEVTRLEEIYNSLKSLTTKNDFNSFILSLDTNERLIVLSMFVAYLNIDLKENYLLPNTYIYDNKPYEFQSSFSRVGDAITTPITHIVIPFISIPYDLDNIKKEWFDIKYVLKSVHYTFASKVLSPDKDISYVLEYINFIGMAQYILSMYISKYSPLINFSSVDYNQSSTNYELRYESYIDSNNAYEVPSDLFFNDTYATTHKITANEKPLGCYLPPYKAIPMREFSSGIIADNYTPCVEPTSFQVPFTTGIFTISSSSITVNAIDICYQYTDGGTEKIGKYNASRFVPDEKLFCFVLPNYEIKDSKLDIKEIIPSLKDNYYEPILEAEPYNFYSISLSEMEQTLSKLRYYQSFNGEVYSINFKSVVSYNESYKIGVIPIYNINGVDNIRYYSEGLVTLTSSQLPIIEDSWINYYTQNKAQMKNQYAVQENSFRSAVVGDFTKSTIEGLGNVAGAYLGGKSKGEIAGVGVKAGSKIVSGILGDVISNGYQKINIRLSQQSKMADMGAKPDTVRLAGSDMLYDLSLRDLGVHLNHYSIDTISYNSISKYLERTGYLVNIQDELNIDNRIGLNYIKLISFDFVEDTIKISSEQANAISNIFSEGVTLLHDKDFLHNLGETGYHNYETKLKDYEGGDN